MARVSYNRTLLKPVELIALGCTLLLAGTVQAQSQQGQHHPAQQTPLHQVTVQPSGLKPGSPPVSKPGLQPASDLLAPGLASAISHPSANLELDQDPRLDVLIEKRIEFNKKLSLSPQGYRIVLYSGKVRQMAYAAQEHFKRSYPGQEAYLTYAFPNFKITAGDYKSKEQATQMLNELKSVFSDQPLLIVPQKIDLSKAYEPEQQ